MFKKLSFTILIFSLVNCYAQDIPYKNQSMVERSASPNLTECFIRENHQDLHWPTICEKQKLSEGFIEEFQNEVDWDFISSNQNLSEDFIRKFSDRVNWYYIFKWQNLSNEFINDFKNKVDWRYVDSGLAINNKLRDKFKYQQHPYLLNCKRKSNKNNSNIYFDYSLVMIEYLKIGKTERFTITNSGSGTYRETYFINGKLYKDSGNKPMTYSSDNDNSETVHVNGYYRKDGTYVRSHTRSRPRR